MLSLRVAALLIVLLMFATACADGAATTEVESEAAEAAETGEVNAMDEATMDEDTMDEDTMDEEAMDEEAMDDMEGMDMGDPDATPADELSDAVISSGEFVLLDSSPEGYEGAGGEAFLATNEDGTTATLYATGLPADTEFIAHIHEQACADDNGGDHFKFDPDGSDVPPNEIHLNFTSDADGAGTMTVTNEMVVDDTARALVIHPADLPDNRTLCADLA